MKNIWIFNHYATNMYSDKAGRHFSFAKYLLRTGYNVRIFCASTIHNSAENLITGSEVYREEVCDGISFTFIKARDYTGNGKQRMLNMFDYYRGLFKVTKYYDKPDVIIGSSVHPLACVAAINLGKKYKCRKIAEIRDLWPESIVAYGVRSKNDLLVKLLYRLEKWIYTKGDAIIFTMEGGRDYIIEKGWDTEHGGSVDLKKVHYINNGVDLELFDYNREHYQFVDADLDDKNYFKVVYSGSIRTANNISFLVSVAEQLQLDADNNILILIFGNGSERASLEAYCNEKGIHNLVFKGSCEKHVVPAILNKANVCVLNYQESSAWKYGGSQNKLFEYFASGHPVISNIKINYCLITRYRCGYVVNSTNSREYADALKQIAKLQVQEYKELCNNSLKAANDYDVEVLTEKLCKVITESDYEVLK